MSRITDGARPRRVGAVALPSWFGDAVCITVLPALFLYSGLFQRYPLPGWVDPGMYLGYFFDFPGLLARYGVGATTYHGTRLSWVLPSYWLHQGLEAVLAQQILVASMFFPSVWAAFLAGRGLGGRLGGHLAAGFLAYNPLFLAAVSFGAIDGITVTYLMAAAACLFAPHQGMLSWARATGFGVFGCLAAIAHPFGIPLSFAFALAYVLRARSRPMDVQRYAIASAVGAVATFAVLASIGTQFGLPFWLPGSSVQMAKLAINGLGAKYRIPADEWIFSSYRLVIPSAVLLALGFAAHKAADGTRRQLVAIGAALAASCMVFLVIDMVLRGTTLQARNYTNLALPACALGLAALAQAGPPRVQGGFGVHMTLMCPALLVAASYAWQADWFAGAGMEKIVFAALCAAAAMLAAGGLRLAGSPTALAVLALAAGALNQDSANVFLARTRVNLKDAYLGASELVRFVNADARLGGGALLFWYRRDAFTTGNLAADRQLEYRLQFGNEQYRFTYFDTLVSLYLYDRSLLDARFPAVADPRKLALAPGGRAPSIILLTQRADEVPIASAALAALGWDAHVRARHQFESASFHYTAWVLDLCPAPDVQRRECRRER